MPALELTPRERIMAALAQTIALDGYANARVQEVAKDAHVSLRTFYGEFDGKEEAFLAMNDWLLESLWRSVRDAVDFAGTPWQTAMRDGFTVYVGAISARPKLTAAVTSELMTISAEGRAARDRWRERFADLMIELVERGRAANPKVPARSLTRLHAHAMLGAMLELVASQVVDGDQASVDAVIDTGTDMLWSIVTNAG
ncbi:MAG: TetR/AcrR family transcriptional regulator [Patulibacter minatonensis]